MAVCEMSTDVRAAAGPLTLVCDLLKIPATIPPIIPLIKPENAGAPEAIAIPIHKGTATRKTTSPDKASFLRVGKKPFIKKGLNSLTFSEHLGKKISTQKMCHFLFP